MERIKEMEQLLKEHGAGSKEGSGMQGTYDGRNQSSGDPSVTSAFSADVGECGVYFQVDLGRASLFLCGGRSDGAS